MDVAFLTMAELTAVDQFTQITGADDSTAKFFLSAANGNCDAAVSAFFEAGGMIPPASEAANIPGLGGPPLPTPTPRGAVRTPSPAAPSRGQQASTASGANAASAASAPSRRRTNTSRIATLGSLERERDDDEKGYYAGGEKSGQMIQDPRKRDNIDGRGNGEDGGAPSTGGEDDSQTGGLAEAILERARARGPRSDEERAEFEGPQRFSGAGYRLGDADHTPARPAVVARRNVTRVLTFYANGFRIDEGPLRPFDDPANEAFLADVNRGVVPKEMEEPGVGDVSITLVDRKDVDFVEKRPTIVPFSGGGQRLDGGSRSAASSMMTTLPSSTNTPVDPAAGAATLTIDDTRPVTRVQIRLTDGTRLVARLNEDHTVGDLRQFVRASRPGSDQFKLLTTFPRKELNDDSQTIKDAQLNGAVILLTPL